MTPQSTVLNDWSDYWFYEIGVNIIPANTREKNTFVGWSEFQDKSIPEQVHEARKKSGHYNNGIALIPGKLWRGPYAEKYLVAIDLDNNKAIEEFCRNNLEKIKQQTIVEQTANPEKMHLYFIVDREIPNKSSDKVDLTKATKIQANEIPALEVKSNGKGLMFCAYSPHKNGSNYQIKGTLKPQVFEAWGIQEQIGIICDKYNIPYGSSNSGNDCAYIGLSIQELFTPGTKILEGHNRHLGILRVMDSLLLKNMGLLTLEQIKELAYQRNQQLCVPPLDNKELDRQWKQALEYANRKKEEREHLAVKKQHLEQNHDQNNNDNENDNDNNNTKTKTLDKQDLIEEATRLLISLHRFLTIEESKDILFYDDEKGVYVKGGEILIEKELEKVFEFRLRTSDITEIKNHIMRRTYVRTEQFDADLDIINLKNGLYNWRTNEFSPHTPDYYSLNQKPIKYNPDAEPKLFLKFLNEVLYQEDITTAKELMAYTFIRKNLFEYYFILIGKGANGKSVFVGILSHLHGLNNI
ncbi:MAG TPA: bifunctional DNA primase/polymerase, partial [Nitrososphaeraceae archaeon]|nr:bifunctional DNA primase/polymerase [Nitrososphaeraceae archaeon]